MEVRPEDFRTRSSFSVANRPGGRSVIFGAPAIPARDVQVMNFEPRLFEQQKRARHVELDVIRMGPDRDSGFYWHGLQLYRFPSRSRLVRGEEHLMRPGGVRK